MDILTRREAVQQAQKWLQSEPLFLDTETTGTGPQSEVIEIAVVDHAGALLYNSLVRPKGRIEPDSTGIHGITPADVQDERPWEQVWPEVEPLLAGRSICAYNSDFDLRLLKQTHQRAWLKWTIPDSRFLCVMKLYARFQGDWDANRRSYRWHKLENAGRQSGISLPNSHHASDDALLARALLLYMAAWQGG